VEDIYNDIVYNKNDQIVNFLNMFRQKILPDYDEVVRCQNKFRGILKIFELKQAYVSEFGFSIITKEVINTLSKYNPILEIGGGSGYISKMASDAGIDIICTGSIIVPNLMWNN